MYLCVHMTWQIFEMLAHLNEKQRRLIIIQKFCSTQTLQRENDTSCVKREIFGNVKKGIVILFNAFTLATYHR